MRKWVAPRNLKEPVFCRFSHLKKRVVGWLCAFAVARLFREGEVAIGVWVTLLARRRAALVMSDEVGSV